MKYILLKWMVRCSLPLSLLAVLGGTAGCGKQQESLVMGEIAVEDIKMIRGEAVAPDVEK